MTILLLAVAGFAVFSPTPAIQNPSSTDGGTAAGYAAGVLFSGVGRAIETPKPTVVTTTTSPKTAPTSGYLTEREVRQLIALRFEPADVDRAVRVAWCESTFNASSVDVRTGGLGLFHLDPGTWQEFSALAGVQGREILDPEANVAVAAYLVYQTEGGWSSFICRG